MKERILPFLSLILVFSGFVFAQQRATGRTVTNADLEKFRQKRLQAERDYRENYEKRGMPSPAELERREAERREWLDEYARQADLERTQNEGDLRRRAAELKTEIASVEAQIVYLRGESNGRRSPYVGGTVWPPYSLPYGFIVPGGGGRGSGYGGQRGFRITPAPSIQLTQSYALGVPNVVGNTGFYGGGLRGGVGSVRINTFPRRHNNIYGARSPRFRGDYVVPAGVGGGYVEPDELKSRLNYLEQVRAGLLAEWSALEEEARRAGVKID